VPNVHHFAPLHNLTKKIKARLPTYSNVPKLWVPDADIYETESAYQIDIEVPGVTDKEIMMIQWMSPRTLVVQGLIERSIQNSKGDTIWEQEDEGWPNGAKHPPKASPIVLILSKDSADGIKPDQ